MKKFIFIFVLFISSCGALVDEQVAVNALQNAGFTNIKITDKDYILYAFRGCSEDDSVIFMATATNPAKKKVEVSVCAGWPFKGATVRY